jgi:SAM-dependent methyltransferase
VKTPNPHACANPPAEKAAEAAEHARHYTERAWEHWTSQPYRAHTMRHIAAWIRKTGIARRCGRPARAVELCMGCGVNLWHLHAEFPGVQLAGLDISKAGIALANRHLLGDFRVGDAEDAPWDDGAFDVGLCVAAAHHFTRAPGRFYFELARLLAPGGLLYVFEPDKLHAPRLSESLSETAERVKAKILALNGLESAPKRRPGPRSPGEGPFDAEAMLEHMAHYGIELLMRGRSEYLSEWARWYPRGFEHAVAFDRGVTGGNKVWMVLRKGRQGGA